MRTLGEALAELDQLTAGAGYGGGVIITSGKHHYREGQEPHFKWEVIGMRVAGSCYPPVKQADDLLEAIEHVIGQMKE